VWEARADLGKLIDAARYGGQHTILTKSDQPRAVLVLDPALKGGALARIPVAGLYDLAQLAGADVVHESAH